MHHQALNAFIATEDFLTVQSMHKGIKEHGIDIC